MSEIKSLYEYCLKLPVHNHRSLHEYDLYERQGKELLSHAIINDFGEAELFTNGEDFPANAEICEWNYFSPSNESGKFNSRVLFNIPLHLCNKRLILNHFSLNPNFSLFIRAGHEEVNLYHNTKPGSKLISYFDASAINNFGVVVKDDSAEFKLWSPPAGRVQVLLFDKDQNLIETSLNLDLKRQEKGIWFGRFSLSQIPEITSFDALYYQYLVYAYGRTRMALDPYAWSMASVDLSGIDKIGKGAIIDSDKIIPLKSTCNKNLSLPHSVNMITYEAHIRDFTSEPGIVKDEERGTYAGFANNAGHISQMGFTHVQLMPVMNFYTVNEKDKSLYAVHNNLANYNWGYDVHHFFAPEGWYSAEPDNPYSRIYEVQNLAKQLHNNNLGVIYDVVYNHTYLAETLENISPGWYYRHNSESRISGHTGAGAGLETRHPMTRKLIIESLKHYIKYFGANGFRFDLLSFFDHETLKLIRDEAGKEYNSANSSDLLLYGEGWEFTDLPSEIACTKLNPPPSEISFALFNDCLRDGLMGHNTGKGLLQGDSSGLSKLAASITGGCFDFNPGAVVFNNQDFFYPYNLFSKEPEQTLNFISVHDGFTLWDKINLTVDSSRDEKIRRLCQAATVLFTSQGKILWHGGEEFIRTKPLGENDREPWRAHTSDIAEPFENVRHFHENSFGASDFTNMVRRNIPYSEKIIAYVKGLNEIRKALKISLPSSEQIRLRLRFIEPAALTKENGSYRFISFSDIAIPSLTFNFVNGPADSLYYLCGEIHPKGTDGNPLNNPFAVRFDVSGNGYLSLNRRDIESFNKGKWGSEYGIKIKLVKTPGEWDSPSGSYSPQGNNVLLPQAINENFEILIDLSQPDCICPAPLPQEKYLAFILDLSDKQLAYSSIIVIHNFTNKEISISHPVLKESHPVLLADSLNAGIKGIDYSHFASYSSDGILTIAAGTSVIAGIG